MMAARSGSNEKVESFYREAPCKRESIHREVESSDFMLPQDDDTFNWLAMPLLVPPTG